MQLRNATIRDKKEAIEIARELSEWFSDLAINNMITDFKLNNLVVARDESNVLGFLCYSTYHGKVHLLWMGVKKDSQRKGIGEKLLKWVENEAKKHKIHLLVGETLPEEDGNEPYKRTRAFYYKNGFKRVLYLKARIKGWDDQIVIEKILK